jgi:hypothetical protein
LVIDGRRGASALFFPIGQPRGSRIADFAGIGIDGDARLLSELSLSPGLGVFQAIGLAVHLEDMNVVSQSIEQRAD